MSLTLSIPVGGASVTLPLIGTSGGTTISWGDANSCGSVTVASASDLTCAYTNSGVSPAVEHVTILAPDTVTGFGKVRWTGANTITGVTAWSGWTSLSNAFFGATQLSVVPSTLPSTVTDISSMFSYATSFNANISSWVTSNVTSMKFTFTGATAFNQNVSSWDLSKVTDLSYLFYGATAFNNGDNANDGTAPLSWSAIGATSGVSLAFAFSGATAFNQSINSWSTSNINNMADLFAGATAFNNGGTSNSGVNPITWTALGKATGVYLGSMFSNATAFNQSVSTWDVSRACSFTSMFANATAFNNGDRSNDGTAPLSWAVLGANQNTLPGCFSAGSASSMFYNATSFNQDVSSWGIAWLNDMTSMFQGATLFSTVNYSKLLNGWASESSIPFAVGLNVSSHYDSTAASARTLLTTTYGWYFTDLGLPVPTLSQPGAPTLAAQSSTSISVTLATVPNASSYTVYTYSDSSLTALVGSSHTNFTSGSTITGLSAHTQYWVTVVAVGNGTAYSNGSPSVAASITTLATPTMYVVAYRVNGGTGSVPTGGSYPSGATVSLSFSPLPTPASGKAFVGWATSATGTVAYTQAGTFTFTMPAAAVTLYAIYATKYAVTYNGNGKTSGSVPNTTSYVTGQTVTVPYSSPPLRTNYQFAGWATSASGAATYTAIGTQTFIMGTAAITLYAAWVANNSATTVNFNANGGSGTMTTERFVASTSKTLTANTFSRSGYNFLGWATSSTGPVLFSNSASVHVVITLTLYAVWGAISTVHFNANGGTGTMAPQTFTKTVAQTLSSNTLGNIGHTFLGWAATAGGSVLYTNAQSVVFTSVTPTSLVLYAVWS